MNRKNLINTAKVLPLIVLVLLSSCSLKRDVTVRELKEHIVYLSSDLLKGRLTGSPGDSLAAVYIRKELISYGLVPLSGDGFQRFEVTKRIIPGKNNTFSIGRNELHSREGFYANGFQFRR